MSGRMGGGGGGGGGNRRRSGGGPRGGGRRDRGDRRDRDRDGQEQQQHQKKQRDEDEMMEDLAALQQQDEMSDDDNAAPDMASEPEERENPLVLALEDLQGRVATALNDIKIHPGVRSSSAPGAPTVHEELATLMRPVLEVAAHTGPSIARTYYNPAGGDIAIENSCDDVYDQVVSDLVLPLVLEMAQSETIPSKRTAALEFFHNLWKECHKAGSWLDNTTTGPNAGPYASGGASLAVPPSMAAPGMRATQRRRQAKRVTKEGEILRYWTTAANACMIPGTFTNETSEGAVASRGVIAASAALRPSLRHISQKIQDADDRGANKLYGPVMRMIESVVKKLFLTPDTDAALGVEAGFRSACIKFLEIVTLSCSSKAELAADRSRRKGTNTDDFSIEDLPPGHPVITREALESIADYAFTTLRGLVQIGGQVKIDVNLLSESMLSSDIDNLPSSAIVSILKPAALAYLEIEDSVQGSNKGSNDETEEVSLEFKIDRTDVDLDFALSQKSYALSINAVAMLATNRPPFFKEAATCLAKRAYDPPKFIEGSGSPLSQNAIKVIANQLKAACMTMLRNPLSVTSKGCDILHMGLTELGMTIQADKAMGMAKQAAALKTASRAARQRANMFYEWDRVSKRKADTDDALAKMRAAKAARGLGSGIQLPANYVDAVELILVNLEHLPSSKPTSSKKRKRPITLEYVVDAVMTNGASLSQDEEQWYKRDGGTAWSVELGNETRYRLDPKTLKAAKSGHSVSKEKRSKAEEQQKKLFHDQCNVAASGAFGRIVKSSGFARSDALRDFGNQITARLAWTLKGVQPEPASALKVANDMAVESIASMAKRETSSLTKTKEEKETDSLEEFVASFPLVASCLALDVTRGGSSDETSTLSTRVLNEAYLESCNQNEESQSKYKKSLDIFLSSVVHSSEAANEKPGDNERKKLATAAASSIPQQLQVFPLVTSSSLTIASAMCDIAEITKKAKEAGQKSGQQTLAASAATHAAKVAAEKRATAVLMALRDVAFQRNKEEVRSSAVDCAVAIASGRLPASESIEQKALKLVMNILLPKSESLEDAVVDSAIRELEGAADFAVQNYEKIQKANKEAEEAKGEHLKKSPSAPASDEEKEILERVKKPAVLFMALAVRRPEMIKKLLTFGARKHADILAKALRATMSKLTRASATKHGAAAIALQVAEMASDEEVPMLLAFLDNLAPSTDKNLPSDELIEAIQKIQDMKLDAEGNKDPRFIIPVASGMKRASLIEKLPEFVVAKDDVFMAALDRMNDRVQRHALVFRDEPDPENPTMHGMTLCEQLVFLHKLDFAKAGIPQKRYLDVIRLCLEEDEMFTDTVLSAALDYMSGKFLEGDEKLPLAYMRTIILTCSKHESLHSWICHVLLPRLIEGKVYNDRRQWEGWMRCAKMLENTGDSGVSSLKAIQELPEEQLEMYRAKYPQK